MSMEKRGVIDSNTPSGCCGGGCHSESKVASDSSCNVPKEPTTEKEADSLQDSLMDDAIRAVEKKTNE